MAAQPAKAAVAAESSTTDNLISIIIPVLNDADALKKLLPDLQNDRLLGHEVLIVDGGSMDGSVTYASALVDRVMMTGTGRGRQMNLGAEQAQHSILLFLHADSKLPINALANISKTLEEPSRHWGRFDVILDANGIMYRVIACMMNLRSRITGVATGDQGIFVRRLSFHEAGSFDSIPIMEDIALSKALRKQSRPACLSAKIITSARRWQQQGTMKTILQMWLLRFAYFIGIKPDKLVDFYRSPEKSVREDKV